MVTDKIVIVVSIFISGCAFLPVPLTYLNYARTGYDVTQIVTDKPTLADKVLSEATDMDCKFFNALDGEDICKERLEE
jgi:maltodextrin utilization protein YvdJ